ncbi:MAG: hypothetical protein NC223_08005 [Butyrivibrio sp.]|nr:hypothetical protein [Butyrivibrio sp.]
MKNKNLRHVLRKINILKLLLPALALAAALILLFLNPADKNIKAAPLNSLSQLDEYYSSGSRYIQYTADSLYYSGVDCRVNGKLKARVYYSLDGQNSRCYFFIISSDKLSDENGEAGPISLNARLIHNDNMYRHIIASLSDGIDFAPQGLEAVCSDILISQYDYAHGFGTYYNAALTTVCALFGLVLAIGTAAVIFPALSPSALRLRRYGAVKELFAAACEEFGSAPLPVISGFYITDSFVFHISGSFADIIPIENITWIYTSNEIRRFRGGARISSSLCLLTEGRRSFKIRHVSKKSAAAIISELQTKNPSIMADGGEQ